MNLAVPIDFSYTRSDNSGTSIPAEPADSVVREKPCPMVEVDWWSLEISQGGWEHSYNATVDSLRWPRLSELISKTHAAQPRMLALFAVVQSYFAMNA